MKGYTIQNSIDLLEKGGSGGGGGGSTSATNVTYDNTQSGMSATNVQSAVDELDMAIETLGTNVTTLNTKVENATTFPTDNTPIVIGKYGERDIKRKRMYVAALVTGENSISDQLPTFEVLIDYHGYVKTAESSPRYMPVCCDINTANFYAGTLTYGPRTTPSGSLWVGSQFNGGSAEFWIDYVEPVPVTSKKKGGK